MNRGWNAEFGQKFMKSFHSGVICPQTLNFEGVKQVPHSEQTTGQWIHCREILFILCSPRAREFAISGQLFCRTYGCGATGLQSSPIFGFFCLFSPHKTRKTYFPVTSLQPRGYIAEWFDFCRAMLCIARLLPSPGVRLSVCLSITFVSCAKTNKNIFEIFSPLG